MYFARLITAAGLSSILIILTNCSEDPIHTDLTTNDLYVPFLVFIYHCKTNRFIFHKKELIESGEYKDFDIGFRMRG